MFSQRKLVLFLSIYWQNGGGDAFVILLIWNVEHVIIYQTNTIRKYCISLLHIIYICNAYTKHIYITNNKIIVGFVEKYSKMLAEKP